MLELRNLLKSFNENELPPSLVKRDIERYIKERIEAEFKIKGKRIVTEDEEKFMNLIFKELEIRKDTAIGHFVQMFIYDQLDNRGLRKKCEKAIKSIIQGDITDHSTADYYDKRDIKDYIIVTI